jgi:hypothetical protein
VFFALGFLGPASASIGALVRSTRADIVSTFDVVLGIPWLVLVALLLVEAWRGQEVQLRPHGIRQSWVLGSLTVPWEALPAGSDAPGCRPPLAASDGLREASACATAWRAVEPERTAHGPRRRRVPRRCDPALRPSPNTGPPSAARRSTNGFSPSCLTGTAARTTSRPKALLRGESAR